MSKKEMRKEFECWYKYYLTSAKESDSFWKPRYQESASGVVQLAYSIKVINKEEHEKFIEEIWSL